MKLSKYQLLAVLDMYAVCRVEGQVTEAISFTVQQVAEYLSMEGYVICSECYDVIENETMDNVAMTADGRPYSLCNPCMEYKKFLSR